MEQLLELDRNLTLFVNGCHSSVWDGFFYLYSKTTVWIPLYISLLYLIFTKYRKNGWLILLTVVVAVALADQIASGIFKPLFERLRPSREPSLEGIIHLVNGHKGGLYGFASSHAANTSAAAMIAVLLFRHKLLSSVLILWTLITSYSRVYLGVHYVGDVVFGTIIGVFVALICYILLRKILFKYHKDNILQSEFTCYADFRQTIPLVVFFLTCIIMFAINV